MKRVWTLVLLLSLGLNLGLGLQWLLAGSRPDTPPAADPSTVAAPPPDLEDDAAALAPEQVERLLQRRLERMSARLDLSPAQRDALWDVHRDRGVQVISRRHELRRARAALQELYATGEPTLADAQAAQRRISTLQTALDSVVVEVMHHERAILTPQQRQQYRGFFAPMREGPRGRGEHPGRSGARQGG
jgi:Spy/CpxP family protein refolding chaperone